MENDPGQRAKKKIMSLTYSQQQVKDEVLSAIRQGQKRVILEGSAGTGKTYLASEMIQEVIRDYSLNRTYNNGMIYATAPTNKALAVLQDKIHRRGTSIEFKTIHSALKLKRVVDRRTGIESYIPGGYSKQGRMNDFKNCKIAFVDESSMISSEILGYLRDYNFPIIFIGDRKQINPVGEVETPVFNSNYPIFTLTEIIRQGEGNPIIDLSQDLDMIYFKIPNVTSEGKGYVYNNNIDQIIEELAEINGTDEMKYLAWTNIQIDTINTLVRQRIYGDPMRVELGETLVFNAPIEGYYTNKEVKVERLDVITDLIPVPRYSTKFDSMNYPLNGVDYIKMRYYRINNSFNIVHEDSDGVYKAISKTIADNCKKYAWDWRGFFYFTELFADVKYNHAISIHKSQGSTYKRVVINVENVDHNKNAEERQRLMYTAVTRASDLVILNNVK